MNCQNSVNLNKNGTHVEYPKNDDSCKNKESLPDRLMEGIRDLVVLGESFFISGTKKLNAENDKKALQMKKRMEQLQKDIKESGVDPLASFHDKHTQLHKLSKIAGPAGVVSGIGGCMLSSVLLSNPALGFTILLILAVGGNVLDKHFSSEEEFYKFRCPDCNPNIAYLIKNDYMK
jgi:hypothetical protein